MSLNNCVSNQYNAIMSRQQTRRLEVSVRYNEFPDPRSPKAFTCQVQAEPKTSYLFDNYYEFQIRVSRLDHGTATEVKHRYSHLFEFVQAFQAQFPHIILPHFPAKDLGLKKLPADPVKIKERVRGLQNFFVNVCENGLISAENFLKALREFAPDSKKKAEIERKQQELLKELGDLGAHLDQQVQVYRQLNPDLAMLVRLTDKSEKLAGYFRFLLDRSYKVVTALKKISHETTGTQSPSTPEAAETERFDIETEAFVKVTTASERLAKETRNFLESFETSLRRIIKSKNIVPPRTGFNVGTQIASEAFGLSDLSEENLRELELHQQLTEYVSAIECSAEVYPKFTEEERKEIGLIEAQLHDFTKGALGDLRVMLAQAVRLRGGQTSLN